MKKLFFYSTLIFTIYSCNSQKSKTIQPIKVFDIKVAEPSGLSIYKNHLYTVSDHNGSIYKLTKKGVVVDKVKTKFKDVEGLTINASKKHFWIVNETSRTLIKLDFKGKIKDVFKIKGEQQEKNSGLEGVCLNTFTNTFFVVNEKSPKELLEVSKKGKILNSYSLKFGKDISGITYDKSENLFWILSDESQQLYKVSTKGKLLKSYNTPIKKAEGIVVENNKIYIVSDSESKLYIFEKG